MNKIYFPIYIFLYTSIIRAELDVKQLKCLVCQATLEELDNEISSIDPRKTVDVGSYRLDADGNAKIKSVPQAKSEVFLSDLIDGICNKMDDYVRATWKSNGQLTLLRLMDKSGNMNPDMSRVDIIQDGDLNKSLKYYCEGIMEDYEDTIIKEYQQSSDNIDIRICTEQAKYCSHTMPEPDHEHYDEL